MLGVHEILNDYMFPPYTFEVLIYLCTSTLTIKSETQTRVGEGLQKVSHESITFIYCH